LTREYMSRLNINVSNGGKFKLYTVLNGLIFPTPTQPRISIRDIIEHFIVLSFARPGFRIKHFFDVVLRHNVEINTVWNKMIYTYSRVKNGLLPRIRTFREITFFMLCVTRIFKSYFECLRLVTLN
jgi:hypothetical protein